jgi:dihydroorotase
VGNAADICIFDPKQHWTVTEEALLSAGKNTPFLGWELSGKVTRTLLAGRTVFAQQD